LTILLHLVIPTVPSIKINGPRESIRVQKKERENGHSNSKKEEATRVKEATMRERRERQISKNIEIN
jgi:hypothetical protein